MRAKTNWTAGILVASTLALCPTGVAGLKTKHAPMSPPAARQGTVLWKDPSDIASRDLYYGIGGRKHAPPSGKFQFLKEDLNGTNPKFDVRDENGVKWKVKMGNEAQPETAAARIVWAAGYFVNEDYFVPELKVEGLPRLQRGQKMVGPDSQVRNVRLKRDDEKKAGAWSWRDDPFTGTREWNGLRVLMALIDNWDLKDENNAIYERGGERVYMVSDLGASFGSAGRTWPVHVDKGNLPAYQRSRFVRWSSPEAVSFQAPAAPEWIMFFNVKQYFMRLGLEWIGRDIPRDDARWMGRLLGRLSPQQINDAFRAAGYSPEEAAGFARVLQSRIATLIDL